MRKARTISMLLILGITLAGCGNSKLEGIGLGSVNGKWTATLAENGATAYQFSATLTQGAGTALSISNVVFTTSNACLSAGQPASGSYTPANGAFQLSMASPAIIGPDLVLNGTLAAGTISGTWTLSEGAANCNQSGTFTMQPSTAE
jgi:hypothetical protein